MTRVGVIPAAGYALRLAPLRCSKEAYPIQGRPVMDYILERLQLADCDQLRVVTRPEKADVIARARAWGAEVIQARPPSLAASLLRGITGLAADDTVLIGFPDSIWDPADGYGRVLGLLEDGWSVGLGLFRAPLHEMHRYEAVIADEDGRVERIEFKPPNPSSTWLWGCAVTTPGALGEMGRYREPGVFFDAMARRGQVGGCRLAGRYLDIGTPDALRLATDSAAASSAATS